MRDEEVVGPRDRRHRAIRSRCAGSATNAASSSTPSFPNTSDFTVVTPDGRDASGMACRRAKGQRGQRGHGVSSLRSNRGSLQVDCVFPRLFRARDVLDDSSLEAAISSGVEEPVASERGTERPTLAATCPGVSEFEVLAGSRHRSGRPRGARTPAVPIWAPARPTSHGLIAPQLAADLQNALCPGSCYRSPPGSSAGRSGASPSRPHATDHAFPG